MSMCHVPRLTLATSGFPDLSVTWRPVFISSSFCAFPWSSSYRTVVMLNSRPPPVGPYLFNISVMTCFQIKSHSGVLGVRMSVYKLEVAGLGEPDSTLMSGDFIETQDHVRMAWNP